MSETRKSKENTPWKLTPRGKVAAFALAGLAVVGAKDLGQGILNYDHARQTPIIKDVDARIGQDADTLWGVAREAQPKGNLHPFIDRLVAEHNNTEAVQPNERIVIHDGHIVNPSQTKEQASK